MRASLLVAGIIGLARPQPVPDSGNGFTWSVYYPTFVKHPPTEYIETSVGGMVQPALVLGSNGTSLITQDFWAHPIRSLDGGRSWAALCASSGPQKRPTSAAPAITPWSGRPSGIGQLADGRLLVGTGTRTPACAAYPWASNCTLAVNIFRIAVGAGGHCTWEAPHLLPTLWGQKPCVQTAAAPRCDNVGGDASNRFKLNPATGEIYYTGTNLRTPAAPGLTLPAEQQYDYSVAYTSTDLGKSFAPVGVIGRNIAEVDILPVGNNVLLASLRYQQSEVTEKNQSAGAFYAPFYKQTAVSRSTDGGKNWQVPGLVTGYLQQTGSLAALADGTIILAFGHKDDTELTGKWVMFGQRFIVSYDGGRTFSRTIFDLAAGGMYAATVALPPSGAESGNQTLVTVCANSTGVAGSLHVLRWQAPAAEQVRAGGFFTPIAPSCASPAALAAAGAPQLLQQEPDASCDQRVRALLTENAALREQLRAAGLPSDLSGRHVIKTDDGRPAPTVQEQDTDTDYNC